MLEELLALALVGFLGSGGSGTTACPLLRVGVGPRACATGEAFAAGADDATAIFWNPAGLGRVILAQLGLSHHEWFGGIRDENIGLALPFGPGSVGVGAVFSTVRDIELWDPDNSDVTSASARSGYVSVGYGVPILKQLDCGIAVKALYDDLIDQTGTGFCADAGVIYNPFHRFRVALAAQNIGLGVTYADGRYDLPMSARIGFGYEHPRMRALLDLNLPFNDRPELHLGAEYRIHDLLALRGGYRLGPQDWTTLTWASGITAGLGLNLGMFGLDYAVSPYGSLGTVHRLSLSSSFPTYLYGKVRIRVYEVKTGQPVTARFDLHGCQQGHSYTEKDGTFVLEGIEPGWLTVTAAADGYYPVTDSILVEPRTTHNLRLAALRSGFGSLWAVVYDAATRVPVPARVEYAGPDRGSAVTNRTNGSLALRRMKAGEYDFIVTPLDTSYQGQTATLNIEAGALGSHTFLLDRKTPGPAPAIEAPRAPAADSLPPELLPLEPTPPAPESGSASGSQPLEETPTEQPSLGQ